MTEVLTGRFCDRCGERRISRHDYSIVHFFEHAAEALTHFDLKSLLRALKILMLQPGELMRAYLDGRRKPFIGPIQLFVVLNLVFALLGGQTFRVALSTKDTGCGFRRYFYEHLVFSTHIHAFLLAWLVVGGVVLASTFGLVLAILWVPTLNVYRAALFFITLRLMH